MKLTADRAISCPRGTATPPTNRRRVEKRELGLHGKRKTKYRDAGLTGGNRK